MAKTLDFNEVKHLTLDLVMKDEARTSIHVCAPTVNLVEKLQQELPALQDGIKEGNKTSLQLMYNLAADLINVNLEGIKTNGEKLRNEFNLELGDLLVFFGAYLEFINEIKNAKN